MIPGPGTVCINVMADCGRAGSRYKRFALCHLLTFRALIKRYCALSHVDTAWASRLFRNATFYDANGKYSLAARSWSVSHSGLPCVAVFLQFSR